MNWKKFWISTLAVFGMIWITDFVIHGMLLKPLYEASANLWRSPEEMQRFLGYLVVGEFGAGLFLVWIFAHGYKGSGWLEGVRYGLLIGGYCAASMLIMYAIAPYSPQLVLSWIGVCFLQSILAGILTSLIYGTSVRPA